MQAKPYIGAPRLDPFSRPYSCEAFSISIVGAFALHLFL
jgi:hypothetical protein